MTRSGIPIAGKTGSGYLKPGTAIPQPDSDGQEFKYMHSTFVGFFPAEKPEFTIAVSFVFGHGKMASAYPGELACRIAKRLLPGNSED